MNLYVIPLLILIPVVLSFALRIFRKKSSANSSFDNDLLIIKVPRGGEMSYELRKAPLAAEQLFSSLHGLLKLTPEVQEHLSFEIVVRGGDLEGEGISFYVAVPKPLRSFVEGQIYAQYPDAQIREAGSDYARDLSTSAGQTVGAHVVLSKEDFFPIRTFRDFEVDPLAALTSAMSRVKKGEQLWFQLLIRPIPDVWQESGHEYVEMIREGTARSELTFGGVVSSLAKEFVRILSSIPRGLLSPSSEFEPTFFRPERAVPVRLSAGQELELETIENKLTKMGFLTAIRLVSTAATKEGAESQLRGFVASLKQFSTANLNSFVEGPRPGNTAEFLADYQRRSFPGDNLYVLSTEELASIYHLPSGTVETPTIDWAKSRRGEPPLNLPTENCTFFGQTTFRDQLARFGIRREDRRRHMYFVGKTGTGKSTLFKNMIIQDMRAGEGVGVMDPHGEMIDELLDFVPEERIEDVVLFDPSDFKHPVSLNMLECPDPRQKNLMASGLVEVFKKHFGYSWGPRLEYLLNNAILTLLEVPNTTLLGITRLLTDDNYQKYIVHQVKDPLIRDFWQREYKDMKGNVRLATEAVAPIQNKVGRFLASSTIRNILGQAKSTIKLDEVMNRRKILFVNLSKGRIGEDNANLLGSLIISRLQFMAMQRIEIPEEERADFYLYVDEFQNFASEAFASILSEARKYHLCLNLTHQYTAQLPEEMLDAVFGNMGTIASFTLGAPDAKALAPEFAPIFEENDLISLERYHMYVKLMIDGMTSAPFSAISLAPPVDKTDSHARVVAASRRKYGRDGEQVGERIRAWIERQFDLGMAIAEEKRRPAVPNGKENSRLEGEIIVERG